MSTRTRKLTGPEIWRKALATAKRCTKPGDERSAFDHYFIGALSAELDLDGDLLSELRTAKDAVFGILPKVGEA